MGSDFKGIYPYIVSPIDKDGNVMEDALAALVEHLIACGIHGITPLGSTGEFFYLTWEQKKRIVEVVVRTVNHRVPVVAGVASASTAEAVSQAKAFAQMGVDGILGILNVYFPLKQESIYAYFSELAHSMDLPIVVYNNPKFSGFAIETETLLKLSQLPTIEYYKDASVNTGRLMSLISQVGSQLKIFSASAHVPAFVMQMGGVGWMSGPACLIPKESVRLYGLCQDKKWEEAMILQKKLWKINTIFQKYNLAACVKAGLRLQGFEAGEPIAPNPGLSQEAVAEIGKALDEVKDSCAADIGKR